MARSLSGRITERAVLDEVVAARETRLGSARLGEKLRREGLGTDHVTIFYQTSEHGRDEPIRSVSTTVQLPEHGSDTLALIKAARHSTTQVSDLLHSRSHAAARALVR